MGNNKWEALYRKSRRKIKMKTQIEQIKAAKRAYIIQLNKNFTRFSVYLDSGKGLLALWPSDSHLTKSAELLEGQIYSKLINLPAFHFLVADLGTSRTGLISYELKKINPDITVEFLSGGTPSHC